MRTRLVILALILAMFSGGSPSFAEPSWQPPVVKTAAQKKKDPSTETLKAIEGLLAASGETLTNSTLLGCTWVGGALTSATYNGLTITATTGTFTLTAGKTFAVTNTLTLSGTDSTVMTFPATSATIARTDAANTFTGTQTIGALTVTTVNGNTFTAGTGVLTIAAGKTFTANNTITLAGTDAQTYTFPAATDTVAALGTIQSFTAAQTFTSAAGLSSTNGFSSSVLTATQPVADTIQHTQVALSSANILGMAAAPVACVAAPASGKAIIVLAAQFKITRTGTAYANGGVVILQYGNAATGAGVQSLASTIAAAVVTGAAGTTRSWRSGAMVTPVSDQATANFDALGLFVSNQTAPFITGTGTAVLDIWYIVI